MENKNIVIGGIAIVALIVAGIGLYRPVSIYVQVPENVPSVQVLGGSAGSEHTNQEVFRAGLVTGGYISTLTGVTSTGTLSVADMCDASEISFALSASSSYVFPSSTAIFSRCLNSAGDSKRMTLHNIVGSATSTLIVTLGLNDGSSTLRRVISSSTAELSTSTLSGGDYFNLWFSRTVSGTTALGNQTPWLVYQLTPFR